MWESTPHGAHFTHHNFSTPTSVCIRGNKQMITSHVHVWQPHRESWSWEHLVREHAIALGQAIDTSTWNNYGSALNSYLSFVWLHNMAVEPTADTLSLYTVYMCHHIRLTYVDTYLSGICHQLKLFFPSVRCWDLHHEYILLTSLMHCLMHCLMCCTIYSMLCHCMLPLSHIPFLYLFHLISLSYSQYIY